MALHNIYCLTEEYAPAAVKMESASMKRHRNKYTAGQPLRQRNPPQGMLQCRLRVMNFNLSWSRPSE